MFPNFPRPSFYETSMIPSHCGIKMWSNLQGGHLKLALK